MRSPRAFVAAAVILASYPLALVVQALSGGGNTVIHLLAGTGFIIFATSVFGFGLPRWVCLLGAASAGAFGTIFVIQGISDLTRIDGLHQVAFDLLGHHLERLLPDVIYGWFVALLLLGSRGRSRVLGWVVMVVVVGLEAVTLAGLLLGRPIPSVKVIILVPFVWLLFESAKRAPTVRDELRGVRKVAA